MPHPKLKLAVFVSGNGTNLQAILQACKKRKINAEVAVVISNHGKAFALKRAKKFGAPAIVVPRANPEPAISKFLKKHPVDLICLAGFMKILSPGFVKARRFKIINIHPALLPSFPGLNAEQQAFDYGAKITGATVHFVDEGCDTGPIILQKPVLVGARETIKTLRKKIRKVEHQIYSEAIQLIATKRLKIVGRRVFILS